MSTLQDALSRANPNTIADALRTLGFGKFLRAMPAYLFGQVPTLGNAQIGSTAPGIILPDDFKAQWVRWVYARAGAGTIGPLSYSGSMTPGAGQFSHTPSGDIVFNAVDAWTLVDLFVMPFVVDMVTLENYPVTGDQIIVPVDLAPRGVVFLAEATVTAGASTGGKMVYPPGTILVAGQASLTADLTTVAFFAGEATAATVKLGVIPDELWNEALVADSVLL